MIQELGVNISKNIISNTQTVNNIKELSQKDWLDIVNQIASKDKLNICEKYQLGKKMLYIQKEVDKNQNLIQNKIVNLYTKIPDRFRGKANEIYQDMTPYLKNKGLKIEYHPEELPVKFDTQCNLHMKRKYEIKVIGRKLVIKLENMKKP
ncbi:MAG: hypothetical protein QNJ63_11570 [Calothrix sp. MO_192.B10]|nr:hypothetical protein [Calothrix sp. MO_192.B10]